jgi:diphthamide biosynthesis protein 4
MSPTSGAQTLAYTYYDVLALPRRGGTWGFLSKDDIKTAYRRALLVHHPDKARTDVGNTSSAREHQPKYSIDEIVNAYETLVDQEKRAEYNETLDKGTGKGNVSGTHIGVEVFDLEDLKYDEGKNTWSRSCRCGDEHGYILTEQDLEKESQQGEIYVGCRGCSLFIKVLFSLEET